MSILSSIKSFFGYSGVIDTAIKAVNKLGGLDDINQKERVEAFLSVLDKTKHQSPARRVVSFMVAFTWVILVVAWLVMTLMGDASSATEIKVFMSDVVKEPFNYIIGFYFAVGILSGIKK
tara:strand:- start:38 stop:397 length:360 start_codon:yes stop_codon:yes gene_type:complete